MATATTLRLRLTLGYLAVLAAVVGLVSLVCYASLLHDFGKVGVREEVLVKAKKLYPAQLEVIQQRFGLVRRTLENENLKARMDFLAKHGTEKFQAAQKEFDARLAERLREGGFSIERVLVEDLRPVPAVCVMGRPQGG